MAQSLDDVRLQPHNLEAEQAVLGAVLLVNDQLDNVTFLQPEHFYEPVHGRIFAMCRRLVETNALASPLTVKEYMKQDEGLTALGGPQYLVGLSEHVVSLGQTKEYGRIILEMHARRSVVLAAERAIQIANLGEQADAASEAVRALDSDLDAIRVQTLRRPAVSTMDTALRGAAEALQRAMTSGPGTPSGIATLDRRIGGFKPSQLTLLAGRPGMGKTAVALSIARRMARRNYAVIFASLEMPREELAQRMIVEDLREQRREVIPYSDVANGSVSDDLAQMVFAHAENMRGMPLVVINPHLRKLAEVVFEIRRRVEKIRQSGREIGAIFVDHIGLLKHEAPSDYSRITHVSNAMKALAMETEAPVVALAQLNRSVETRGTHWSDKRPMPADLRDSGSLEQDADNILFVFRPEYYIARSEPEEDSAEYAQWQADIDRNHNRIELIVAKQRGGATSTARLACDMATNSFWDLPESPYAQ